MATPFSLLANFNLPGTPGLPDQAIPVNVTGQYTKKAEFEYDFTGAATITVNMGNIIAPGARLVIVMQEAVASAASILVKHNASATAIEVSPGGFIIWSNPTPAAGLTAMTFDHTAVGRVKIWVLG